MTGSPSDTLLGQALALAAAGLAVFPLGPTRVPLRDSHGHLDASKDSADVRRLFAAPAAANIGVATGEISGIDILDTDPRNGAGDWSDAGRLPVTRTYETRRGGRHFVFRHAPGLRCSTGRIAPGVDVKSNGGWATYHPAAGCPVLVEGPIADWPDWLLPKAMAPVRNSPAANRLEGGAVSARSAIEILDALPNPQSNGRDVYVAVMLAAAGAADASDDPAAVGAAAVGWAARWPESPGYSLEADRWEYDWSRRGQGSAGFPQLLARAYRDVEGFAAAHAGAEFPPLPPVPHETVRPGRLPMRQRFLHPLDCETAPRRGYVVKGIIAPGDVAAIIGAPGAGKSMLAPRIAYAVAQGAPVFGMRTRQGRTLYVAAEDFTGLTQRIHALRRQFGDAPDFALVDCGNLGAEIEVEELRAAVADYMPTLVIIDTLGAAWAGMDENSAQDMGRVVALSRDLARTGCAVLLVHHTAKHGDGSPRGHSVLNGTLDSVLRLEPRDADGIVRGTMTKNRNGTTDRNIAFRFTVSEIGRDEDGDTITAPMAIELEPGDMAPKARLTPVAGRILKVLRVMSLGTGEASEAEWRARCDDERAASASDVSESRQRAFNRGYQDLLSTGLVTAEGDIVRLAGNHAPEFAARVAVGDISKRSDTTGQGAAPPNSLILRGSDKSDKSGQVEKATSLSARQRRAGIGQTRTHPLGVSDCPMSAGSPEISLHEMAHGRVMEAADP